MTQQRRRGPGRSHENGAVAGLVLAGGRSARMGTPKAALRYHGAPQVRVLHQLLASVCAPVRVGIPAGLARSEWLAGLPVLFDDPASAGPMAAVLAAMRWRPLPWLVVAVDMPLLDAGTLRQLLSARDAAADATAFRATDGGPEPLCCIYEPSMMRHLLGLAAHHTSSLRDALARADVRLVRADRPEAMTSVDTPRQRAQFQGVLS